MKLLLHICCANCALYPIKLLRKRGIEPSGFWYNPNIHPAAEYEARLGAMKTLHALWGLDMQYENIYGLVEFVRAVSGRESERCLYCYRTRLEETALRARRTGADAFSTTLLYSPYQKFDSIIEIGKEMQEQHGVEFLAEDFRGGFKEGERTSKELGLYRQKYCGCVYSEMERYSKRLDKLGCRY